MNTTNNNDRLSVVAGKRLEQVRFDYAVTLVFSDDTFLRISSPFSLTDSGGERVAIDPEGILDNELSLVMKTLHKTAVSASTDESGALRVEVDQGIVITALPSEQYEAWTILLPGGTQLTSFPGGNIA